MTNDSDLHQRSIDLNADLGEGFANDHALLERVSSASICCGVHAGEPSSILATLRSAARFGVSVGAHPGYDDREGFGRRDQSLDAVEVDELILGQVAMLRLLAAKAGVAIRFLKPHGALYNQAQRQEAIARGVLAAAHRLGLPLLGQPGTMLEALARAEGLRFVPEGFPDRRYGANGLLAPRSNPGGVFHEAGEVEANVVRLLAEGRVETLCIHGDEPAALANADRVRGILEKQGIQIRSFLDGTDR